MRLSLRLKPFRLLLRSFFASLVSSPLILAPWELYLLLRGLRRKPGDLDPLRVGRVLILRPDEIGDVVLTTPLLRELRRLFPSAWLTLVVKPSVLNLVELCPYVDEVISFDSQGKGLLGYLLGHYRAFSFARRVLLPRRFDLALVPRWDTDFYQAPLIAYFSGATWRIGYSEKVNEEKSLLNKGFHRFFTHALEDRTPKHEVQRSLDILRFLESETSLCSSPVQEEGREASTLELWWRREEEEFVEQVLAKCYRSGGPLLIALGIGARSPRRQWPLENYLQVGRWLVKTYSATLLLLGGPGEEALGHSLAEELGEYALNLVGQTTLRQASALLKQCALYVGNDAGPMHLSAGVGVSVVEISCHPQGGDPLHPNSPVRFGPWGVPSEILQPEKPLPPCVKGCEQERPHCILSVTVQQVKEAISNLLESRDD